MRESLERSGGRFPGIRAWTPASVSALIFGFLLDLTRALERIQSQLTGPIWIPVGGLHGSESNDLGQEGASEGASDGGNQIGPSAPPPPPTHMH